MTTGENTKKREWVFFFLFMAGLLLTGLAFGYHTVTPPDGQNLFSRESGFYEEPFYLKIRAEEGATVYYTLDGSEPDETSAVYTEPIYIDDATKRENGISMRTDVSTGFYTDLIERYSAVEAPGYVVPDYPVDKCTVVRVLLVQEDGDESRFTKTYFVNGNRAMPGGFVVCIATDPENLFDARKGIYVTGEFFDKRVFTDEDKTGVWGWAVWDANYGQRGREWERPAAVQIFDDKGNERINKTVGIRIHGSLSRGLLPKGLNLYARKSYDGEDRFAADLFGSGYYAKRLTMEAGGNQIINPVSDYLVQSRIGSLNVASKHYIPCEVYLNGEYWGFHWICEKYDEEFIAYTYGCDEKDVLYYKGDPEEMEPEVAKTYLEAQNYIRSHDMSDEANYQRACELIDIASYIDYYALMIFIGRYGDWPMTNFAAWRTRSVDDRAYHDGKWRWMVFDCNSFSMGYEVSWDHDTLSAIVAGYADSALENAVFASLWVNEGFRGRFREKIYEIAGTCFKTDEIFAFLDSYDTELHAYLEKSWARYYGKNNSKNEEYEASMAEKRTFLQNRASILDWWFGEEVYAPWIRDYTYEAYLQAFPQKKE